MARTTYDQQDISKALTVLAFKAGNYSQAVAALKEMGLEVTQVRLKGWAEREHEDQYKAIRDKYQGEFEAEAIRDMRDHLRRAAEAERLLIQKAVDLVDKTFSAKDASVAALNMAKIKQSNVDKLLALTGRPSTIIEDRGVEPIIESLIAKKILKPMGD
jgi:hypothetical protein